MGLIKAATSAIGSTLHDQWEDYIKCDNMDNDTLMVKVTTDSGVISKNSAIQVSPGQLAVIFQSGKILDATAEEGIYTFDDSSEPSFFAGDFGAVFKEMWTRFTFNGAVNKEQAVYYINTKEIINNKFGTVNPVSFQDWSHPIPNQMTGSLNPLRVEIKCFGNYTFKVTDPAVFMREIAGTAVVYKKTELVEQIKHEVFEAFRNVLNGLGSSKYKTPVLELDSCTDEIKKMMSESVFDESIRRRGISLVGFVIESFTLDEESEKKIDNYELSSNTMMQQGTLVGAYANAVQDAANNAGGAANGFMGIGMMNMASGGMIGGITNTPQNTEGATINVDPYASPEMPKVVVQDSQSSQSDVIKCTNCGSIVKGNFCGNCGTPAPVLGPKKCSNCGTEVNGKFCSNCGTKI